MEETVAPNLEKSLARTELNAGISLKAAQAVVQTLKKYCNALKVGNLKDLQVAINDVEKAELALRQQIATTKASWDVDVDAYLSSNAFIKEILAMGEQKGIRIFERDDRLYCYPVLVRVVPSERLVRIDRTGEKRLRPTVLVNSLKELQKKPPRFRPEAFLDALYTAYKKAVQIKGKGLPISGTVISLLEIYELFTLLPGQSKEYSRQEFARDIYLLDRSGVSATRKGAKVSLPASTGTKIPSRTLSIINENGEEKLYYGISFSDEEVQ
ncbi:MAG: hypothetical protein WC749_04005 [Dehalococcoidia bacterium]